MLVCCAEAISFAPYPFIVVLMRSHDDGSAVYLSLLSAGPQNIYILHGMIACSHATVENRNLGLPLQKYHFLHNVAILVSSLGTVCAAKHIHCET